MKKHLKYYFYRLGIFPYLNLLRNLPAITRWIKDGCWGIAPPPVKRMVIKSYLKKYYLNCFVETGTHLGDTLADVAQDQSVHSISIELADEYYQSAQERFAKYTNVSLFHGDSGKLMPQIVAELKQPTLFWLDGHYSGGLTAKGNLETPISEELQTILASPIKGHVILIDDIRCFDGNHDYPYLDELLAVIRADGRYRVEISTDILRLTPK